MKPKCFAVVLLLLTRLSHAANLLAPLEQTRPLSSTLIPLPGKCFPTLNGKVCKYVLSSLMKCGNRGK